jgi:GT2 family glycosyltransferase
MADPLVSIVVLNHRNPDVVDVCLRTLAITEGVDYEVVVVDNGSEPEVVEQLRQHRAEGRITTLVENPVNSFFSEGNNIGVRNSNPASEFILLLNSDVGFLRPDWLTKLIGWMEGTTESWPTIWTSKPTIPTPGPRDIVSAGWSHDANVTGNVRPEGWCCLYRRSVWQDMSPDFPFHYGFEEQVANIVRDGARCAVLFNYAPYMIHREGGSGKAASVAHYARQPDLTAWFQGLTIESLDFTLGPDEHSTYMSW